MNLLKIIALMSSSLLVACGGEDGPSRDEQLSVWVKGKAPEHWQQTGYSESEAVATLTVTMESPFDIDYKPNPTWKKQSDARRFCPTQGEMANMGFTGFKLHVVTKGAKAGTFAEISCVR